MQKILTKREKKVLYITVGIIIFSVIFNFLIWPVINKNDLLNKEISVSAAKLKKYLRLLAQKDYIRGKYNEFSRYLNEHKTEDTAVSTLSELGNLAKSANIRIIDMRPQAAKASGQSYKEIEIDLRTEGAMEGYLKFIYTIENSLSLLRIKRFQLNAKPNAQLLEGVFSISQISAE